MPVYLDHNATSPLLPEVRAAMEPYDAVVFGNPSSIHGMGVAAEAALEESRRRVARALGVEPSTLVFTGSGTEANNLAVLGGARALHRRGRRVVITAAEHDSVHEPAMALAQEGFEVVVASLTPRGLVDLAALEAALTPDTVLVACMAASNETGALQPVARVGELVRARSPIALFHVDAVQALGKVPVEPQGWACHLLSGSAHKLGGPKGMGFLHVRRGTSLRPLAFGGGQEHGLRPGTQNVAGAVGLATALDLALARQAQSAPRLRSLRTRLLELIQEAWTRRAPGLPPLVVHTPLDASVPSCLSLGFPELRGEVLVRALDEHGLICSTGSACHERQATPGNRTLAAMGLDRTIQESTVRLSLGPFTDEAQVAAAGEAFDKALAQLAWAFAGRRPDRTKRRTASRKKCPAPGDTTGPRAGTGGAHDGARRLA